MSLYELEKPKLERVDIFLLFQTYLKCFVLMTFFVIIFVLDFFFFFKLMLTCYFNKKDLKHTPKSKSSYIYLQRLLPLLLHTPIPSGSVNLLKYRMNDQVMINSCVGQPPLKPHPEPTTPPLLCSWTTNHIPWECILCLICFLHFEKYFIYVFMFIMHLCDFQNLGVWGGQHYKGRIGS